MLVQNSTWLENLTDGTRLDNFTWDWKINQKINRLYDVIECKSDRELKDDEYEITLATEVDGNFNMIDIYATILDQKRISEKEYEVTFVSKAYILTEPKDEDVIIPSKGHTADDTTTTVDSTQWTVDEAKQSVMFLDLIDYLEEKYDLDFDYFLGSYNFKIPHIIKKRGSWHDYLLELAEGMGFEWTRSEDGYITWQKLEQLGDKEVSIPSFLIENFVIDDTDPTTQTINEVVVGNMDINSNPKANKDNDFINVEVDSCGEVTIRYTNFGMYALSTGISHPIREFKELTYTFSGETSLISVQTEIVTLLSVTVDGRKVAGIVHPLSNQISFNYPIRGQIVVRYRGSQMKAKVQVVRDQFYQFDIMDTHNETHKFNGVVSCEKTSDRRVVYNEEPLDENDILKNSEDSDSDGLNPTLVKVPNMPNYEVGFELKEYGDPIQPDFYSDGVKLNLNIGGSTTLEYQRDEVTDQGGYVVSQQGIEEIVAVKSYGEPISFTFNKVRVADETVEIKYIDINGTERTETQTGVVDKVGGYGYTITTDHGMTKIISVSSRYKADTVQANGDNLAIEYKTKVTKYKVKADRQPRDMLMLVGNERYDLYKIDKDDFRTYDSSKNQDVRINIAKETRVTAGEAYNKEVTITTPNGVEIKKKVATDGFIDIYVADAGRYEIDTSKISNVSKLAFVKGANCA